MYFQYLRVEEAINSITLIHLDLEFLQFLRITIPFQGFADFNPIYIQGQPFATLLTLFHFDFRPINLHSSFTDLTQPF